ncbi:dihydroorotate dehydrogenase electron transfer subunit, partial [bacterium]|nr:dihydroorotate dehydrogenase electron transfer subunit [bacterium]
MTKHVSKNKNIRDNNCLVLKNAALSKRTWRIRLESAYLAQHLLPGQFVNVRISNQVQPLLRRPLSIHFTNTDSGWFELLYDVRGLGTDLLSQKKPGKSISVLGPLGNSFDTANELSQAIIVAGGIGVAPFRLLLDTLVKKDVSVTFLYGGRTNTDLVCLDDIRQSGAKLQIATEDGSAGYKGYVPDLLKPHIEQPAAGKRIFACGPSAMLKVVQNMAVAHAVQAELSLEAMMGCGFGICVGCAVPERGKTNAYKLVCQDGPI